GRIAAGPVCAGALWTRTEGIDGGRGAPRRRLARSGLALTSAKPRCHAGAAAPTRLKRIRGGGMPRSARSQVSLLSSARVNRGFVMRRCLLVLLAALSVLILPSAGGAGRLAAAELQPLEIASKNGVHVFAVEMASTPEEQAKGLMFRRQLPEGQ